MEISICFTIFSDVLIDVTRRIMLHTLSLSLSLLLESFFFLPLLYVGFIKLELCDTRRYVDLFHIIDKQVISLQPISFYWRRYL